jgi:hypothetical protein
MTENKPLMMARAGMREYRIGRVASKSSVQKWDEVGGFWDEDGASTGVERGAFIRRLTQIYADFFGGIAMRIFREMLGAP